MSSLTLEKQIEQKREFVGINFSILIPQLTEDFKLKIALGEIKPSDFLILSDVAEKYFIKLIRKDVKEKLEIEIALTKKEQEQESKLTKIIKSIFKIK